MIDVCPDAASATDDLGNEGGKHRLDRGAYGGGGPVLAIAFPIVAP